MYCTWAGSVHVVGYDKGTIFPGIHILSEAAAWVASASLFLLEDRWLAVVVVKRPDDSVLFYV